MTSVFADTFFFLALVNPRDAAHGAAVAAHSSRKRPLLTTAWILTEVADGLADGPDRHLVAEIIADLDQEPRDIVVPASQALFEHGLQLYLARTDKEWSLTDCISFVVMEEHNIKEALTADHHFEQAGFIALLKN